MLKARCRVVFMQLQVLIAIESSKSKSFLEDPFTDSHCIMRCMFAYLKLVTRLHQVTGCEADIAYELLRPRLAMQPLRDVRQVCACL